MSYTNGIKKIFTPPQLTVDANIQNCCRSAERAGYTALTLNDSIYTQDSAGHWSSTCFTLEDFEI